MWGRMQRPPKRHDSPGPKAAGAAMDVMSGQEVDPAVLAHETIGLLRSVRTQRSGERPPATGTVAHWTELVCLHSAGLPELCLRHPVNTTVTPAFRTGKPDWATPQKCEAHAASVMAVARTSLRYLHNHKNRCEERLNPPGL